MAKHKRLKGLGDAMKKRADDSQKRIFSGIRKAALAVDQAAIFATPVDTGFARSRWVVTIGQPVTSSEDGVSESIEIGGDVAAAIAASQGLKEIKKWKGVGSIFINNPLGYVVYLDEGSSEQAPQGMTEQAIAAGQAVLKELKILEG